MANYDKVKILVVGDSGVGKTSAVHLMCYSQPLHKPSWTVGVALEVKLHEFRAGTPAQKNFFLELWDIGGSSGHRNSRHVFYNGVNGIILVHDISNRKSEANLHKWLGEIFTAASGGSSSASQDEDFDPEQFMGLGHIPILVVGTKLDNYSGREEGLPTRTPTPRTSNIAQECGADEIALNCLDPKSLAPGSTAAVKLARFFDRVIDKRFHREGGPSSMSQHGLFDRRSTSGLNTLYQGFNSGRRYQ